VIKKSLSNTVDSLDQFQTRGCLADVSFTAKPFNITGVIGPDRFELRTIARLAVGMLDSGIFDGEIHVSGQAAENSLLPAEDIAYIKHDAYTLYIPGLTYAQTVRYNAMLRLRDQGSAVDVDKMVTNALELMGLARYKNRVISERPITRGTLGGELRRLRVAADICLMPSIIIIEEPVIGLDFGVAGDLMKRLKSLSDLGRTVVCMFSKPDFQTFEMLDDVVMIVEGRSVFNSKRENLVPHFTSKDMGYIYNPDVSNVTDFILDVAYGIERPTGHRSAVTAYDMQQIFESSSDYCEEVSVAKREGDLRLLPAVRYTPYLDLITKHSKRALWRRIYVAWERAIVTKFSEYAVLQKSLTSAIVPSLLIGYFLWGQANIDNKHGGYVMSLFNLPFNEATNTASNMFICNAFAFVTQVLNVHIIVQKMKVFRSEQKCGVMSGGVFLISTYLAEAVFSFFFIMVFSTIVYFMMDLGSGAENFRFWCSVQAMTSLYSLLTCLMLAAVFKKEFIVRDVFLMGFFLAVMLSGFVFTFVVLRDEMIEASKLNPLRWTFEALMAWKFSPYKDGQAYLTSYRFNNFDHMTIYEIFRNFFIVTGCLTALALIPAPRVLRRRCPEEHSSAARPSVSRFSMDSDFEGHNQSSLAEPHLRGSGHGNGRHSESTRHSRDSTAPVMLMRNAPSGASKVALSRSSSSTLNKEEKGEGRGPTLTVSGLSYRVLDPRSPLGHKNILHNITAKFDWGKLCVIMGAKDSGKSTLLHVLSGSRNNAATTITGDVHFDGKLVDPHMKAWQRAAYVEALDEHFRDLSVLDIMTYSMRLRCFDKADLALVDSNVQNTLELLHMVEIQHVPAKLLSRGNRRRLSLAEELVHGPSLILADEPITNLEARDCALIVNSFRDLVNNEKTVITTMHEPSAEVFSLFDTLVLLSKGRVIFIGNASEAVSFFAESAIRLVCSGYLNPADFLADVSGCLVKNEDGSFVDTPALETDWKKSARCADVEASVQKMLLAVSCSVDAEGAVNPMAPMGVSSDGISKSSDDQATSVDSSRVFSDADDSAQKTYWTGTRSMDISTQRMSSSKGKIDLQTGNCISRFLSDAKATISIQTHNVNVFMTAYRLWIVFSRESMSLLSRPKMIIASFILQVWIASLYGILMDADDASINAGAITSYFGIGAVLIMLTMLQLGFYLFNNNKIFLREHNRGLYSMMSFWLVGLLPLLVLRTFQYLIYTSVSHKLMGLPSDNQAFYYINMFLFQLAHTLYIMCFILQASEQRSIYYIIPGLAFFFFYFSGMLVKPSTLPDWCAPWMPSVSPVRWYMQGGVINEFADSDEIFAVIGEFDIYKAYLGFFGWNGKSKYECLFVLGLHVLIAFGMCFLGIFQACRLQTGRRQWRDPDSDDRLF
jgi:ABC-type multidrug transport system ATPase subunit